MTAQVHSFLADLIHRQGFIDRDGFALAVSRALVAGSKWQRSQIKIVLLSVKTDMFGRHRNIPKNAALEIVADKLLERWPKMPLNNSQNSTAVKLLFFAANSLNPRDPMANPSLALDVEIREITRLIRASEYRDSFKVESRWAVRPDDLIQALNEERPDIVHFSGHGSSSSELLLLDRDRMPKAVSKRALSGLFGAMKDIISATAY